MSTPMVKRFTGRCEKQNAFLLLTSCYLRNKNLTLGTRLLGPLESFPSLVQYISTVKPTDSAFQGHCERKPCYKPQK